MKKTLSVRKIVYIGMLAAAAGVLMSFEVSLPLMPPFYKIDFSDVPSIIALFSMGPVAAGCVEVIKILIKLILTGTNSMYVGELANLIGVVLFILPIWLIYNKLGRNHKAMGVALTASIPIRTAFSCMVNLFITLPLYVAAMGISMDSLMASMSAINPAISNLPAFICLATIPFNIIKIALNGIVGYLLATRLEVVYPNLKLS